MRERYFPLKQNLLLDETTFRTLLDHQVLDPLGSDLPASLVVVSLR